MHSSFGVPTGLPRVIPSGAGLGLRGFGLGPKAAAAAAAGSGPVGESSVSSVRQAGGSRRLAERPARARVPHALLWTPVTSFILTARRGTPFPASTLPR